MIKKTVEVSGYKSFLRMDHSQLVVEREGEEVGRVPMEDVGLLVIDSPTVTYTHSSLVKLLEGGAGVVLCGSDHTPAAILTALNGHHLQAERLRSQIEVGQPTVKRLWKRIVQTKILNQRWACEDQPTRKRLEVLASEVKSGDPKNVEAQAARFYWSVYLNELPEFRRRRDGDPPNNLLNYGYMVFRASVARAVVGSGLHPSIGLHHKNRYNAFALVDDLMEPFRPLVDVTVRTLYREGFREVEKPTKSVLLGMMTHTSRFRDQTGPLWVHLEQMTSSLVRCLSGEDRELEIPEVFPDLE